MNLLFYIVFVGQVLLISAVIPFGAGRRLRTILQTFPATAHPQLYPRQASTYRTGLAIFAWTNHLLLLAGLALMAILHARHGTETSIHRSWPAFYGAAQCMPMLVMDVFCLGLFRRLRELDPMSQDSATTAPHRRSDFVPTWLLALAVAMVATTVLADLTLHGFDLDRETLSRNLTLLATNAMLALLGWWKLRGLGRSRHPSPAARDRAIAAQLTVFAVISIAFSAYLLLHAANAAFGLQHFEAILMSLYVQTAMAVSITITLRTATPLREALA